MESLYKDYVAKITTLPLGKEKKEIAEYMIRAVVHVIPIMRKRKWHVDHLMEFLPENPSLLGLNEKHGDKCTIKIRCRKGKGSGIYSYEHILGTLLHELCHIVHSRHDASFYALLEELNREIENGEAKDFLDPVTGKRLGGSRNFGDAREKALRAAEKRQQISKVMMAKPQKLGGGKPQGLSPKEAVAQAALRRASIFS